MENGMIRMVVAVVAAAGVVLAGCGAASEPTPGAGLELVGTERGPIALDGYGATLVGTSELVVELPSCNGDPVLDVVEEDDDEVRIRVVTTVVVSGEDAACADVVEVPLDRPLDDRTVIDLVSGAAIDIISYRDADVELDCFDADYPLEPTFATPEEALAEAVAGGRAARRVGRLPTRRPRRDRRRLRVPGERRRLPHVDDHPRRRTLGGGVAGGLPSYRLTNEIGGVASYRRRTVRRSGVDTLEASAACRCGGR
jgi:hypothetical protein